MADQNEAAERMAVLRQLRSRRKATRLAAIGRLCEMFEPLVKALARAHWHARVEIADLEQVARVGLLEACNGFVATAKARNWNDGVFPTYASWNVRNALSKHAETNLHLVKLPAWMYRRLPKLRRARTTLAQELFREPNTEELAARLKMPLKAVETMLVYEEVPVELPASISGVEASSIPQREGSRPDLSHRNKRKKVYLG